MTTPSKTKVDKSEEKTTLEIIRDAQSIIKSKTDSLIADLQREMQKIADSAKIIKEFTGKNILTDPAFEQSLNELGLVIRGSTTAKTKSSKELAPIKDTALAVELCGVLKKHGKPMDVAAVATAIGDKVKKNTIGNYMARLVGEGVLYRPSRGQFAIR